MRWIKLWTEEIIKGTTFSELSAKERGVWFSILALAGGDGTGRIEIRVGQGYSDVSLAEILNLEKEDLRGGMDKLKKVDKISVDKAGIITIKNFSKYQDEYSRQKPYRNKWLQGRLQAELQERCAAEIEKEKEIKKEKEEYTAGTSPAPTGKCRQKKGEKAKKPVPEGYAECMDLILECWKIRGNPVALTGEHGKLVKRLLQYGKIKAQGLLALFASARWQGWGKEHQGVGCRGFWSDWEKLLDSSLLREFEKKYEPVPCPKVLKVLKLLKVKSFPPEPADTTQMKIKDLTILEEVSEKERRER